MENDLARVDHLFQVYVDGDAAYWPGKAYKLAAADGATGLVVRDRADQVLEHARRTRRSPPSPARCRPAS